MNYPVWDISFLGGGSLIALIATVHVFVAHFAVGGGLFLVITEMLGHRRGDPGILAYVQGHTKFFLLLTMVFSALTGVGIWLTISVLNPAATSILIHNFVFAWATEWVFFLVEIVSLLIYYYTFGRMDPKNHVTVGWIYFIAAWISLFIIDGIISFMLTPGAWLETRNFWDGFFNPSFVPSLFFRTFIAFILAGAYGLITSTQIQDAGLRQTMVRHCAIWLAAPFILLIPSAWWYLQVVSPQAKALILGGSPEIVRYARAFLWISPLVFLGGLIMVVRLPKGLQKALAGALLVLSFFFLGYFEMIREASRRPYIIHGHMYSNAILKSQLPRVRQKGVLKSAKWVLHRNITPANRLTTGHQLFNLLCLDCHSVGGQLNDILDRTGGMGPADIDAVIETMGGDRGYMPPFPGTTQERQTLVYYLVEGLQKKEPRP
ncbi:MAG: cytochrome ubiquinol oxidase subunit I [Deltaproteobacteria bacterium]|nr:cytochrome ubiquinol oxidase subunit I [Deltaproteobacteria bacterium]